MQIPEHVQRGRLSPTDTAWAKAGVPTPEQSVARNAARANETNKE